MSVDSLRDDVYDVIIGICTGTQQHRDNMLARVLSLKAEADKEKATIKVEKKKTLKLVKGGRYAEQGKEVHG
jgi:hypothetical protein